MKNNAALVLIATLFLMTGCASRSKVPALPIAIPQSPLVHSHLDTLAARKGVEITYGEHMTTIRVRDTQGAPSLKEIVSLKERHPEAYEKLEMHITMEADYLEIKLVPSWPRSVE